MNFLQASAKSGSNIESIFSMLVHNVLEKIDNQSIDVFTHPGIKIGMLKYKDVVGQNMNKEIFIKPDKPKAKNFICC